MELELSFKYQGAVIEGTAYAEEDYNGWTYEVSLSDNKSFRMYCDDNEDWTLLRGDNALAPNIEQELIDKIIEVIKRQKQTA
ncbi:MAG TPA: hypothetical protein VF622_02255 [Segetibacter sp.]|jgi:hypothetical protein